MQTVSSTFVYLYGVLALRYVISGGHAECPALPVEGDRNVGATGPVKTAMSADEKAALRTERHDAISRREFAL